MNPQPLTLRMKLFSNTRAKRNTAFVVLLVWLFALASGVANACLLEARATHGHGAAAGTSETAMSNAISAGHVGAVADHDAGAGSSKAPCLKVCDDGSQSLVKQQSTFDLSHPGPALLVAIVWAAAVPVVSAPRRMDDLQPSIPGLPLRVRYSRLAL
jgi:hypothetical protein